MLRPAVLFRCTALFNTDGALREHVVDWAVLQNVQDAHKQMRRSAISAAQVVSTGADQVLQHWLADPSTLPRLDQALRQGGVYGLELTGSGGQIVLSLRPILLLPLASRVPRTCLALMVRGRRLWSQARQNT